MWMVSRDLSAHGDVLRGFRSDGGQSYNPRHWQCLTRGFINGEEGCPSFRTYPNSVNYPLVNVYITMENHHFQWDNPLFLWSFSIANC